MNVTSGLETGQVIQRGRDGIGTLMAEGTCDESITGDVSVAVSGSGVEIDSSSVGRVTRGRWVARLSGVPTGGPYQVRIACGNESCLVADLFVGELWALAGQSNMEGLGDLCCAEMPAPMVRVMDLADHWQMAEEPLHWPLESVDSAHWGCDEAARPKRASDHRVNRVKGAGLGLPFGLALSSALRMPVGLICAARRASTMQDWSPGLLSQGGASLYGSLIRRIRKVGGVRGVLWFQGESDANPVDAARYSERLRELIESIRSDSGIPEMPFLFAQLGRHVAESTLADLRSWNCVQEAQRRAALQIPQTGLVASVDLPLDDSIHISAMGLARLGRRLAILSRRLVYGESSISRGPQIGRISVEGHDRNRICIEYTSVNGSLKSTGRLSGFSLRNLDGHHIPIIFKEEVDRLRRNVVVLWLARSLPAGCFLHYGWGRDPYCNVVDELDLAAPVFGPVRL